MLPLNFGNGLGVRWYQTSPKAPAYFAFKLFKKMDLTK
jgi:hypothetical protein